MGAFEEAKEKAVEKVLLAIAESGSPTKAQLDFLQAMRTRRSDLDDFKEALSVADSFLGFGGARK